MALASTLLDYENYAKIPEPNVILRDIDNVTGSDNTTFYQTSSQMAKDNGISFGGIIDEIA